MRYEGGLCECANALIHGMTCTGIAVGATSHARLLLMQNGRVMLVSMSECLHMGWYACMHKRTTLHLFPPATMVCLPW